MVGAHFVFLMFGFRRFVCARLVLRSIDAMEQVQNKVSRFAGATKDTNSDEIRFSSNQIDRWVFSRFFVFADPGVFCFDSVSI